MRGKSLRDARRRSLGFWVLYFPASPLAVIDYYVEVLRPCAAKALPGKA